jgi:hypothetical protein
MTSIRIAAAVAVTLALVPAMRAQSVPPEGPVGPSPYDVVRAWHKPFSAPGFTFGGPLKLPGYNGRNKTFFFTNIDYTRIRSGTVAGFGNTTPIDSFKNGDFSALLTGQQIGTDALGRPIVGGQIYDPSTTRLVNGIPVRDPFPNNQIPANHPLLSTVASRIVPLMVEPDRAGRFLASGRG